MRAVARRPVAAVAAVLLMCEAVAIALLNWFLGLLVDEQEMSLAGIAPRTMTISAWVGGLVFGGYLLLCAALLLRTALRDNAPRGLARILLVGCAVVHSMLGAFFMGPVGWSAFVLMLTVFALIVLTLVAYGEGRPAPRHRRSRGRGDPESGDRPAGETGPAGDPKPA